MNDNLKSIIDRVLFAVTVAMAMFFAFGMIFSIGSLARIGLWALMFSCAGISGMQVYEYLWRNKDAAKDKILLIQVVAAVVITLAVISLSIFMLYGKIVALPV